MQSSTLISSQHHSHAFDDENPLAERNTRWAVALTAVTMAVEIFTLIGANHWLWEER